MGSLLWDQHTCLLLQADADVDVLTRYQRDGGAFLSVNAGYAPHSFADTTALLKHYRAAVDAHPDLELVAGINDVATITRAGRIAVVFDLEDSRLTAWGRSPVAELNRVGIVPDGSHCSARTGLDMCEASTGPVGYSHSCMRAVWDHPRNITDDQARACACACAETGGVIGITGVGIFLGPNTPTLDAMARHLEYAVDLVGIDHVGISTDFSFDYADAVDEFACNAHLFDDSYSRWGPIQWMPPETLLTLGEHLSRRGWSDSAIKAILSDNFYRVARQAWREGN